MFIMKKLIFLLALLPALLFAQNDCESSYIWGCIPTLEINPVCGCDDVTYPNPSTAACNSITEYTMGICGVAFPGCMDDLAINYNPLATEDDGSCIYLDIPGCTDTLALNYNPFATVDDGSCLTAFPGCMDDLAINYNPLATEDDGSCIYLDIVLGCMDVTACNYNPEANLQDFTCEFAEEFYDCEGGCLSDTDSDGICDGIDNCILISNFDQLDTDSDGEGDVCDFDDHLNLKESKTKEIPLLKMVDVLGREFTYHPKGKILFYIYQDNSVEKRVIY